MTDNAQVSLDALAGAVAGGGFDRRFTAAAYWPRIHRLSRELGVTRIGEITGLDDLGVPVAQACRPMALSNAVTQGKGWTLAEAALGAALECIEMAAGETLGALIWKGDLSDEVRGVWNALADPGAAWPAYKDDWRTGWRIAEDQACPVPAAVLSTDFTAGGAYQHAPILRSTIGLGAGACFREAAVQGLLECVENDARIRSFATPGFMDAAQIKLAAIADNRSQDLLQRLKEAGLRVGAWNMTRREGPPCIWVRIMEHPGPAARLPLPADGFACRPYAPDAFAGAVLEAAQGRLAAISGAREDMTWRLYDLPPDRRALQEEWEMLDPGRGLSLYAQTAPTDLRTMAKLLETQGCGPVIATPLLWRPDVPLAVCRVSAPGLIADPERLARAAPA